MNNKKCYGPFQLWVLNNFPFTIDDWDSVTQYQMLCKCLGALKEQLDVNSDLYKKISDLENLDLQDEVNNKIDEMAESGELQEIITEYLQINGVLAFNTVSDMISATNIINGSVCKTLGQTTYNDGKGAFYKIRTITSGDVVDNYNIIALNISNTLIAERIPYYNIENLQGEIDTLNLTSGYDIIVDKAGNGDYTSIATAVSNASSGDKIFIKNGNYTDEVIDCVGKKLSLIGESRENVIITNSRANYYEPPLNIGKGYVENVTIKAESASAINNQSYAVHIDNNDEINEELIFKNCFLVSRCNSAVGIGLKPNCYIKFHNCQISTTANYNNSTNPKCAGLFVHTSQDVDQQSLSQQLVLDNCLIEGINTPAMALQSCQDLATNQGQITMIGCSLNSQAFAFTDKLIIKLLHSTSSQHNLFIKGFSLTNSAQANHSTYKSTPVVIDKLGNDELNYLIKRVVISDNITAGTQKEIILKNIDNSISGFMSIEGSCISGNLEMPLFYNDGTNSFRAFLSHSDSNYKLILTSSGTGTFRIFVKYYSNMETTPYE